MPFDAELHVRLTEITEGLLTRIASHTSALRIRSSALNDGDRATARMMLSDLRTVTALWQTLAVAVNRDLESAVIDLLDARNAANRHGVEPAE